MGAILPVPAEPDPAAAATPHQLPAAPLPPGVHFVDDQIKADLVTGHGGPARRDQGERHPIPVIGALPRAADSAPRLSFDGLGADAAAIRRYDERTARSPGRPEVDLDAVGVDVVRVVVEPGAGGIGSAEGRIGLADRHRDVEGALIPGTRPTAENSSGPAYGVSLRRY